MSVPAGPRTRILIAGDNEVMCEYLTRLLAHQYELATAGDARQTLQRALEHPPDLIIVDATMAALDPCALLDALRAHPATAAASVILLSAGMHARLRAGGSVTRADDVIARPFSARELLARVNGAVKLAQFRREALQREAQLRQSEQRLGVELEAMNLLYDLSTRLLATPDLETALQQLLDATMEMSGANMGYVQLYHPHARTLEIFTHQGVPDEFLAYFRIVGSDDTLACARAMRSRERVVIEDILDDSAYAPHRKIAAMASYRAVQATPLVSREGQLLGMLTIHFHQPRRPSERDLRMLDLYACHAIDVIERLRAEQALRESEERFRALAEASPALIWQLDPAGHAVYLNRRFPELTGRTVAELSGTGWHAMLHPDDRRAYVETVEQAQRERTHYRRRARVRDKDGNWRWVESYASPWFCSAGKYAGHVGIWIDITEAVQLESAQATYRMATEGGNEGFYIVHPVHDAAGAVVDFTIVDSNHRGAEFVGLRREDLIGMNVSALYQGKNFDRAAEILCQALATGFYEDDVEVREESPLTVRWVHCKIVRSNGDLAVTLRDISEAKAYLHELERRGNEDALTGLPNRYWVQTYLPQALERAAQNQAELALLFMDLDGFKAVNDALGHAAGDELLRKAARRLKVAVRPQDKVARLGGDEFVIILENIAHKRDAAHVAQRVLHAFHEKFRLMQGMHAIGTSIGISIYPSDGRDADTLLRNADIAMYSVKTSGKHSYRFFDPDFYSALRARMQRESELRDALEHDQFVMHYQPRIDLSTGRISSMEALVRWMHPSKGLLDPLEFIPLAEETGLILRLGELVIEKVCAQLAQWKQQGLDPVPVSVNVSPRQFSQTNVARLLSASLVRHQIDPAQVEVELTESSMMGDGADIDSAIAALRKMGVRLLVDDFGTGYSSLSQLQRLDFDVLKVDRTLTVEMERTDRGNVFFNAIITMAHALGMRVVAEGVENARQAELLKALRCDEIQGFLVSKPLPPAGMQPALAAFCSWSGLRVDAR